MTSGNRNAAAAQSTAEARAIIRNPPRPSWPAAAWYRVLELPVEERQRQRTLRPPFGRSHARTIRCAPCRAVPGTLSRGDDVSHRRRGAMSAPSPPVARGRAAPVATGARTPRSHPRGRWTERDGQLPRPRRRSQGACRERRRSPDGERRVGRGGAHLGERDGKLLHQFTVPGQAQGVAFVDDAHVAVAPQDGGLLLMDLDGAAVLQSVRARSCEGSRRRNANGSTSAMPARRLTSYAARILTPAVGVTR